MSSREHMTRTNPYSCTAHVLEECTPWRVVEVARFAMPYHASVSPIALFVFPNYRIHVPLIRFLTQL